MLFLTLTSTGILISIPVLENICPVQCLLRNEPFHYSLFANIQQRLNAVVEKACFGTSTRLAFDISTRVLRSRNGGFDCFNSTGHVEAAHSASSKFNIKEVLKSRQISLGVFELDFEKVVLQRANRRCFSENVSHVSGTIY